MNLPNRLQIIKIWILLDRKNIILESKIPADLAPSSVKILNFWTRMAPGLKFSQNDVLMSTSFCENFSPGDFLDQKLIISTQDGAADTRKKISKCSFFYSVRLIFW